MEEEWQYHSTKTDKELLTSITDTPYEGIGRPEALKYQLTGLWSRRINQKDRLVYEIKEETIIVYSLKGHYSKD